MDMVQKVARAIYDEIKNNGTSPMGGPGTIYVGTTISGETVVDGYIDPSAIARAAIAAMSEPTEGMADAFCKAWRNPAFHGTDTQAIALGISAMIDAALTSSEKP